MNDLIQDLRLALRQLVKNPAFTTVAVLTLALGIGANTAIFSAVNAVLMRPLPYPESDRLAEVTSTDLGGVRFGVSYPDLQDLRGMNRIFTGVAAYATQRYNLSGAGDPREVQAAFVTADLFDVLRVHPVVGHAFTPSQDREPLALLSNGLWSTSFGRDQSILGKSISLDGKPYTVIGVMPAGFHFPDDAVQVWTPVGGILEEEPRALTNRSFHALNAVARLAPGVTPERVARDLDLLAKRIAAETAPDSGERRVVAMGGGPGGSGPPAVRRNSGSPLDNTGFEAVSLRDSAIGDVRTRLLVLLGAVGLVLLIACANAANLLLARAATRRREMAIRRALGAGRGRLIRQLLTESVLLSLAAAGVGLVFSTWGLDALLTVWPRALPRGNEIELNGAILAFTAGLALVTGIGFGLAPALRASAQGIEEALRDDAAGATGGRWRGRLQGSLIVGEVALALVLLVGAGLLVRSFIALNRVNPGYDTRDVLAARIRLTPARFTSGTVQKEFFNTVLTSLRNRPDVAGASLTVNLPLSGSMRIIAFDPRQIRADYPEPIVLAKASVVTPDYFSTLRIPIRRGRSFGADDRMGTPRVAVVSEKFARDLWPGESPIGKQFPLGNPRGLPEPTTIIGVIDDLRSGAIDQPVDRPEIYVCTAQETEMPEMWVVARTRTGAPLKLAGAIRDAVHLADAEQPIGDMVSLTQLIGRQTAARRFNTTLLGVFALLAVGLALIGIYGVTGYAVAQRHRELGIRMALGARPTDVVRMLVAESLRRVGLGVVIGLGVAFVATRALTSMLFGIAPSDVSTFVATAILLAAVALLATWLPARRATRVDPMVSLRTE
jgi:putative ABC transport system permease protein